MNVYNSHSILDRVYLHGFIVPVHVRYFLKTSDSNGFHVQRKRSMQTAVLFLFCRFRLGLAAFEESRENRDIRRVDTGNAAGLSKGSWADLAQLASRFEREIFELIVIDRFGDADVFKFLQAFGIPSGLGYVAPA